jgi:hypothetical protein
MIPLWASAYMPIPGLDARRITQELKLKLEFYCTESGVYLFIYCLFVFYINMGFYFYFYSYFLSVLLTLPSLSSCPYSHPFSLPPSPVLKSIALLPNNSFCSYSFTLCSCPHILFHSPPTYNQTIPSSYTLYHLLTNPLYQLYTTSILCYLWHEQSTLQQLKYTQTHTRVKKISSPHNTSPIHQTHFTLPLLGLP